MTVLETIKKFIKETCDNLAELIRSAMTSESTNDKSPGGQDELA